MYSYSNQSYKRRAAQWFDLLRQLVSREMKVLYKRSFLGIAWTLINPLLQLAALAFVFQVVLPVDVPRYPSFVFCGLLAWNWFQATLFQSAGVIVANGSLIRQPRFPIAILPVVTVTVGLIHFLLALPILIIFLLIDGVEFTPFVLLLPFLQMLQLGLTVSLGYILAALNVTFRDTQHTLGVVLLLMFYLTPVFYSIENVPEVYQLLYACNPMVVLIEAYRSILLRGLPPAWMPILFITIAIFILLPLSYHYFERQSNRFAEEL